MTTTPTDPLDRFFTRLREPGLVRGSRDTWLGGVAVGIARRFDLDPVIVRVAFVLLAVVLGIGVTLYLVLWLLLPDESGHLHLEEALRRGRTRSLVLLVVTALSLLPSMASFRNGDVHPDLLGLAVIGLGVWYIASGRAAGLLRRAPGPRIPTRSPEAQDAMPAFDPATGRWEPGTSSPSSATPGATAPPASSWAAGDAGGPVAHPVPARMPRRRLGRPATALVLLLAAATFATTLALASTQAWPGAAPAVAGAAALAVLGLGLLVAGHAGRRSGPLSAVAVLAALALAIGSVAHAVDPGSWSAPDQVTRPASVAELPDRFATGAGASVLDLSAIPASDLAGKDLQLDLGAGEMTVVLPEDTRADVTAQLGLGEISWTDPQGRTDSLSGAAHDETFTVGPTDASTPALTVQAHVGLGELVFERK